MLLSTEQFRQLARERVQSRARLWSARVDQGVPAAQRQEPASRLEALTVAVLADLPPDAPFEAADVRHAADGLAAALRAGAPWDDTRAAAQLHGAAGLGALWFMDDRLLPPGQQIDAAPDRPEALSRLLAEPQGQRFKQAAVCAQRLGPGLRMALHRALAQQCTDPALYALVDAAFVPPDPVADAETDESAAERVDDVPVWPPAARAFLAHVRDLQARAGLTDPVLSRLCLAGDLALGLGRCVRLLAAAPPRPASEAIDFLTEALHAATRHQH
jgi:hypothetical protein